MLAARQFAQANAAAHIPRAPARPECVLRSEQRVVPVLRLRRLLGVRWVVPRVLGSVTFRVE